MICTVLTHVKVAKLCSGVRIFFTLIMKGFKTNKILKYFRMTSIKSSNVLRIFVLIWANIWKSTSSVWPVLDSFFWGSWWRCLQTHVWDFKGLHSLLLFPPTDLAVVSPNCHLIQSKFIVPTVYSWYPGGQLSVLLTWKCGRTCLWVGQEWFTKANRK